MSKNIIFVMSIGVLIVLTTLLLENYVMNYLSNFVRVDTDTVFYFESFMTFIRVVVLCVSVILLLKITKTNKLINAVIISALVFITYFLIRFLIGELRWYFSSDLGTLGPSTGEVLIEGISGLGIWLLLLSLFLGTSYSLVCKAKLYIQYLVILINIICITTVLNSYKYWVLSSANLIDTTYVVNIDKSKNLFLQHIEFEMEIFYYNYIYNPEVQN